MKVSKMLRCATVCFLVVLLCSHPYGSEAKKYGIEDAINDVSFFIPGSKAILTAAMKIWLTFGKVKKLVNPHAKIENSLQQIDETLEEMSDKLDNISDNIYAVQEDIHELNELVRKGFDGVANEQGLFNILHLFESNIASVESQYRNFLKYSDESRPHENETLLHFADKILDLGINELSAVVDKLHGMLVLAPLGKSALDLLADKQMSIEMMCKRGISPQHKINTLYNELTQAEIKNLIMHQFAYEIKNSFNKKTFFKTELEESRENSYKRISQSIKGIKKAMNNALREFWNCGTVEDREGETYAKLGPVMQSYVTKEKDTHTAGQYDCQGICKDQTDSRDACKSSFCKKQKNQCKGRLRDCQSANTGELRVCLTENRNSSRRYEFIHDTYTDVYYGQKKSCPDNRLITAHRSTPYFECDICTCTCTSDDTSIDRFFSLRPVTSDVFKNKVVTGVRLQKENNIFHIQIKQGVLLQNGNVNASTNDWKAIDNFTIQDRHVLANVDYHMITYDQRTIHLDDIDSALNHAVTGLKFVHDKDYLKLGIQVTPFDFEDGTLHIDRAQWMFNNDASPRTEVKPGLDLPTASTHNRKDSTSNQFIKFKTSSMKTDMGQTVVPFLELKALETEPPVPLSGAGLIHKSNDKSAGYIGFKLFTYNFAPHLQA